eukprot:m.208984 g.208984  ORF g.208984 m.208984 type:complete len:796 (-) comp33026_c0_seq6:102-2489(-)
MHMMVRGYTVLHLIGLLCFHSFDAAMVPGAVYTDASAPIPNRVQDLLSRMTTQEKVNQMLGNGEASPSVIKSFGTTSVGSVGYSVGSMDDLEKLNAIQAYIINTSRLGIPIAFTAETLHSGGNPGCTVFPMPAGQGASWNKTLVRLIAQSNALQARASGTVHGLAPVLNVATDPRFGRTQECFGEDPIVVATMGVEALRGLQGDDGLGGPNAYLGSASTHVMSQAKHFGAYGFGGVDGASADISERTLYERYLYPWLRFAQEGGKGAMAAHNSINYEPVHGSAKWMTHVFRDQLGFGQGFIGADSHNVKTLFQTQQVANSIEDAAVLAVEAGLDQDLNTLKNTPFCTLANSTIVNMSAIDRAAANVLRYKFALGLFDAPFANTSVSSFARRDDEGARKLAREAAQQSIVLLKNDNSVLPMATVLQNSAKHILVVGELGGSSIEMLGDYNPKSGVAVESVLAALQNRSKAIIKYVAAAGPKHSFNISQAIIQHLDWADVTVAVVGDSTALSTSFGQESCGEMADRANLDVAGPQYELLDALTNASSKSKLIVVMIHGRPVTFGPKNKILNNIDGLLAAWRPGEEGAGAIVDLIDGSSNPSAKLTQAWPQSSSFIKSAAQPWMQDFAANSIPPKSYWDDTLAPLFPMGFGLSYTTFSVTSVVPQHTITTPVEANTTIMIPVMVNNTGSVDGATVIQIYTKRPLTRGINRMQRQLAGFEKVFVPSSHSTELNIPIRLGDLARYNPVSATWVIDGGNWTMWAATCAGSSWGAWNTGKDHDMFDCVQSKSFELVLPTFEY